LKIRVIFFMFKFLNKKIATVVMAAAGIIGLHYLGILQPAENYLSQWLQPAARITFRLANAIGITYQTKTDQRDLASLVARLEAANNQLLADNIGLKILADENEALRQQLAFYSRHNYQKVLANVISRESGAGENKIMVIDKGRADGVAPNQAIIIGSGIVIGKIFLVKENLAYGYLITDERSQLAAVIAGKEGTGGVTKGELGLTVRLDFIPQTESVQAGEVVTTSGLESNIPRGLIIGSVVAVTKETNDLFQSAVISPAVNLNNVSIVSVILQ